MKKTGIFLALLALTLLLTTGSGQASIIYNFNPDQDAFVNEGSKETEFNFAYLLVGEGGGNVRQTYLKFDLSDLSGIPTANVLSVTLYLYYYDNIANTIVTAYHGADTYPGGSAWLETGLNWNNQPTLGSSSMGSATVSEFGWISIDLLAGGDGWISDDLSDGYLTVAITPPSGLSVNLGFYSNEAVGGGASYHPYLRIEVVPLPSTALLFGTGLLGLAALRFRRR